MSDHRQRRGPTTRPGWSWRRGGSPLFRWLSIVGGPLLALSLVALYAIFPDPSFIGQLVVVLFLPMVMIALVLFEETGLAMRRDGTGRTRRSRRP